MSGLFPEKEIANTAANEVWKRREVDKLLDCYLTGMDLGRLAATLSRNRKAVVRKLQEYIYNERDRVLNYQPRLRASRAGKRLTYNERQIIKECRARDVPDECIARVLARTAEELGKDAEQKKVACQQQLIQEASTQVQGSKNGLPATLDLIWAHRYLYFELKRPVIADSTYDDLVHTEIEFGGGRAAFERIKAEKVCPDRIRCLALYLSGSVQDFTRRPELVVFGIGEVLREGEYGMWWGPSPDLQDALNMLGHGRDSRIVQLSGEGAHKEVYWWSVKHCKWKRTAP